MMLPGIAKEMIFVAVLFTLIECSHVKSRTRVTEKCRKLSQKEEQSMLRELTLGLHWSFLISPQFKQTARKLHSLSSSSDSPSVSETHFDQAPVYTCPAKFQPGTKICPWHYVHQTDFNRIPENIIHARCTCKHCSKYRSSILSGDCEEVNIDTLVWKRTDTNCIYEKQIEQVTVACVCRTNKKHL